MVPQCTGHIPQLDRLPLVAVSGLVRAAEFLAAKGAMLDGGKSYDAFIFGKVEDEVQPTPHGCPFMLLQICTVLKFHGRT